MKFTKGRKEALSKMLGSISTASAVGLIFGSVVESKVGWYQSILLVAIVLVFGALSLILKSDGE